MVTTEQIKELREQTGISVMQCKKALEEAGGDFEKAVILLRKQGARALEKKADRTLGAGIIASYVHSTGTVGAMVELRCETDFVAKNDEFRELARNIAMHVTAASPEFLSRAEVTEDATKKAREVFAGEVKDKPADMQEKILVGKLDAYLKEKILLEQDYIKDPSVTVQGLIEQGVQKFGERIELSRFVRLAA